VKISDPVLKIPGSKHCHHYAVREHQEGQPHRIKQKTRPATSTLKKGYRVA
jgi:hypothetical protein